MKKILVLTLIITACLLLASGPQKGGTSDQPLVSISSPIVNDVLAGGCVSEGDKGEFDDCRYGVTLWNECDETVDCDFTIIFKCNNGKKETYTASKIVKVDKGVEFSGTATDRCCNAGFDWHYEWECN